VNRSSKELTAYLRAWNKSLNGMAPPKGTCGCFTATFSSDGRMEDVQVVYSNWPDASDFLPRLFKEARPIGPPPAGAECLVGARGPGAFGR
jgi:hypothetical protein